MMKNIKNNILRCLAAAMLLLGTTLSFTGCYETEPPMVSVSKQMVKVDQQAQSVTITIVSNSEWTLSSDASWCIPSVTKGRGTAEVDLVISRSDENSDRQAVITITTKGANKTQTTVTVSQSARNCQLIVSPQSLAVGNAASTVSFAVSSNADWTVTSSAEWAVATPKSGSGNGIVSVAVAENVSHSEDRVAQIAVTTGNETSRVVETVTLTQSSRSAAQVFLTHSALHFTAKAKTEGSGKRIIDIITNVTGDIIVSSDFSWCNAVYADGKITVSVDDNISNNARAAIVNVMADVSGTAITKQIIVTQDGLGAPAVTLAKDAVFVAANNSSGNPDATIPVAVGYIKGHDDITTSVVEDYPSWITNVKITDNLITFEVAANPVIESRSTTLTVKAVLADEITYYPITVTQMGEQELAIVTSSNFANMTAKADTVNIALFAKVNTATFTAYAADAQWCKTEIVNVSTGTEATATLRIIAEDNAASQLRTCNVIVMAKSPDQKVYASIAVSQAGVGSPQVEALQSEITLPSEAIKASEIYKVDLANVDAGCSFKVVSSQQWVSAAVNSDKSAILFTTQTNNNSDARTASITVIVTKGDETQFINIGVTQLGTGSAEIMFESLEYGYSAYGTKKHFVPAVAKNGTSYKVIQTEDWIEATVAEGGINLTVKENPSSEARTGSVILFATNGSDSRFYTLTITQDGIGDPDLRAVISNITVQSDDFDYSSWYNRVRVIVDEDNYSSFETVTEVPWLESRISYDKKYVELKAQRNDNVESRSAVVTIIATRGGSTKTTSFTVTQLGTGDPGLVFPLDEYFINANSTSLYSGYDESQGTPITFTVLNGSSWYSYANAYIESKPDWVTSVTVDQTYSDQNRGRIWVKAENNPNAESRSGELTFRVIRGGVTIFQSITLTQLGTGGPNIKPERTDVALSRWAHSATTPNMASLPVAGLDNDLDSVYGYTTATWYRADIKKAGDSIVFYAKEANNNASSRTEDYYLRVIKGGVDQVVTISVTQAGTGSPAFEFSKAVYYVTAKNQDSGKSSQTCEINFIRQNNAKYTEVYATQSWAHANMEGQQGDTFTVTVDNNTGAESRSCEIVFRVSNEGGDEVLYQSVKIVQNGIGGPNLAASITEVTVGQASSSSVSVPVTGLADGVDLNKSYSTVDWLTADINSETSKVTFRSTQANASTESRTGYYHLYATKGGQEQDLLFTITQLGTGDPGVIFSSDEYTLNAQQGQYVTAAIQPVNGSSWTVASCPEWTTCTTQDAYNLQIASKTANENAEARSGVVVLKVLNGDKAIFQSIEVTQLGTGGPNIVPARTDVTLKQQGGSAALPVAGLKDVEMTDESYTNATWFTAAVKASGDSVVFTAEKNTSVESRSDFYYLKVMKGRQEQVAVIRVTQLGTGSPALEFATEKMTFTASAVNDTAIRFVPVNGAHWNIDVCPEFINPGGYISGDYTDSLFVFDVQENTAADARTGEIIFRVFNEGKDEVVFQSVQITQNGKGGPEMMPAFTDIVLQQHQNSGADYNFIKVPVAGLNDITLKSVISNVDWMVYDDGIKVDQANEIVQFIARTPNTSSVSRTCKIYLTGERGGQSQTIEFTVTQLGTGDPSLTFPATELNYGSAYASGVSFAFTVNNNAEWEVVSQPSFVTNLSQAANSITFTVAANSNAEDRSGIITFKVSNAGGDKVIYQHVTVNQAGVGGPNINFAFYDAAISNSDVNKYIKIPFTGEGEVSVVNEHADWIYASADNSNDVIMLYPVSGKFNTAAAARNASVVFKATKGGKTQLLTVTVSQAGTDSPELEISNTDIEFASAGASVNTYVLFKNTTGVAVSTTESWLTVSPTSMTGSGNLQVTAASYTGDGARDGIVTLIASNSGEEKTMYRIFVTQNGVAEPSVVAAVSEVEVPAAGIASQTSYGVALSEVIGATTVTSSASWLTANVDGNIVKFTKVEANNTGKAREAYLTVTATNSIGSATATIKVKQPAMDAPQIVVPLNNMTFNARAYSSEDAGKVPVVVLNSTKTPEVQVSESWVSAEINGSELKIYPNSANTTGSDRTAIVTLRIQEGSTETAQTIFVTQKATEVTTKLEFVSNSGTGWKFDAETSVLTITDATKSYEKIILPFKANDTVRVVTVSPLSSTFKWRYRRPSSIFVKTKDNEVNTNAWYDSEEIVEYGDTSIVPYTLDGEANYSLKQTSDGPAAFVNAFRGNYRHTVYATVSNPQVVVETIGFGNPATAQASGLTEYVYDFDKFDENDFQDVDNYKTWIGFNASSSLVKVELTNTAYAGYNLCDKMQYSHWTWNNFQTIAIPETEDMIQQALNVAIWRNPYGEERRGYIIVDAGNGVFAQIVVIQPAHSDTSDIKDGYIQHVDDDVTGNTESYKRKNL